MTFLDVDDMFLSQLAGTTEALWSGVTTVMDHSHIVTSEERAQKCIRATIESGIRSIYCVAPFAIPMCLNPIVMPDMDIQHPEQIIPFKKLAKETTLGGAANDGRVTLGLGYDTMNHRPIEEARDIQQYVKDHDFPVNFHDVERYNFSALRTFMDHDLHCDPDEARLNFIKKKDIGVVSTPESEMAMSHG